MIKILSSGFFDHDALHVAKNLLGKILRHKINGVWLSLRIIETEAYRCNDRASHAFLGYTEKRKPLFMPPGTIYMYLARGHDSFNTSCRGQGSAVLFKAGFPYYEDLSDRQAQVMLASMQNMNWIINLKTGKKRKRPIEKLASGQTLLCKSLGLKMQDWHGKLYDENKLRLDDIGYRPTTILQTTRLGIPVGRDEYLPYRFIDQKFVEYCTNKPKE